jgi:flavin-dependent dehydrogenase
MQKIWDVIVVGGGPAGSSATRVIADAGYSVVILDKKRSKEGLSMQ